MRSLTRKSDQAAVSQASCLDPQLKWIQMSKNISVLEQLKKPSCFLQEGNIGTERWHTLNPHIPEVTCLWFKGRCLTLESMLFRHLCDLMVTTQQAGWILRNKVCMAQKVGMLPLREEGDSMWRPSLGPWGAGMLTLLGRAALTFSICWFWCSQVQATHRSSLEIQLQREP